jgi:hypothetical protein
MGVARNICLEPRLVPGGGAVEMAVSRALTGGWVGGWVGGQRSLLLLLLPAAGHRWFGAALQFETHI